MATLIKVLVVSAGEEVDMVGAAEQKNDYREEFFENDATDVEEEDVGEAPPDANPWDPGKIRISTKPFSLRQVVDMIEDRDIDLAPDFQRLYVWKPVQRARLIESILLGIPLPAFYFNQDHDGVMQVVDGVQRLTSIRKFVTQNDPLESLEYLKELEGKTFAQLSVPLKRRFQQTQIFANVIEPQTPDDVKFDVFKRINTGGSPLTAQEIRHCMSRSTSRDLLKHLTLNPNFHTAVDNAFRNERRMTDREVALRFCAFRSLPNLENYRAFISLDAFLLDFIRQVDGNHPSKPAISKPQLQELTSDFDRAMRSATIVFGNAAFRKFPTRAKRRGPINRALFDSWSVALADYEPEQLQPRAEALFKKARELMEDNAYNTSVSQGTGDITKVLLRFGAAGEVLKGADA